MSQLESSYARLMGVRLYVDVEGREQLLLPFGQHLLGRPGFLHGGAIAGLLALACDHAMARETSSIDRAAAHCLTSTFQFLRVGREQDLRAAASMQRGRSIWTVQAAAWQETESKPIATVTRKYGLDSTREER
jgi:acyl-coenzyme A thioesterase PaaI-like protein